MRYRRVLKPNASTGITTFKYTRILFICEILQPKTWLKLPVPREILSRCHPIQLPQHTHIHTDTVMEKMEQRIKRQAKDGKKLYCHRTGWCTEQGTSNNIQRTEDFSSISYSMDLYWFGSFTFKYYILLSKNIIPWHCTVFDSDWLTDAP